MDTNSNESPNSARPAMDCSSERTKRRRFFELTLVEICVLGAIFGMAMVFGVPFAWFSETAYNVGFTIGMIVGGIASVVGLTCLAWGFRKAVLDARKGVNRRQ